MKRSKRFALRAALCLSVAAVFVPVAQAEPMESDKSRMSVAPAHVDFWNYDESGRKIADSSPGVSSDQLAQVWGGGSDVSVAPDDMGFSRPSNAGSPSVVVDDGYEFGPGTVGGISLALALLLSGSVFAVHAIRSRKTKLSPA